MGKTIIVEGKTSTEAIEKGLKELKCRKNDVDIKILESEDKRSFFSILEPRVVKVELTVKEGKENHEFHEKEYKEPSDEDVNNCQNNIETFLKEFTSAVKNLEYKINVQNKEINVELLGEKSSDLIGYRGDTINAMQTILSSIGNKNTLVRVRVLLDIANYKEKREETLKELARKLEKTVKRNGKKIILEPMNSYERKIIHTELQNSEYVTTYSMGEEPRRKVVIEKK